MQTFETFFNNFILTEGYKEAKTKFNSEPNVNEADVTKYCDLHRKLKELHRLNPEHIDINKLHSKLSFIEFKSILDSYGEYATLTRDSLKQQLTENCIGSCEGYSCYKIKTPQQAYLFHGVAKWCTNSGTYEKAAKAFNNYTQNNQFPFYICMCSDVINSNFQYIAILILPNNILLWNKNDELYVKNVSQYDIQNCNCKFKTFNDLPVNLVKIVNFVCEKN